MRKPETENIKRYPARINLVATQPLVTAVASAASRNMTSINAYCRRALLAQLQKDGVKLESETEAA
jgi:hypothetical protein